MDNLIDQNNYQNNDVEVEMALLSLCMRKSSTILEAVANKITSEDFSDRRNQLIFGVIMDMFFENAQIDRFTVFSELETRGLADNVGGLRYIYRIGDLTAVQSAAGDYIAAIKERSSRIKIMKALERVRKELGSGRSRSDEIVDFAITEMSRLKGSEESRGFKTMSDVLKTTTANLIAGLRDDEAAGKVKLGFPKLDTMLGGLRPGSLNVLAARPGVGKSALAMNMAMNVAANGKTVVLFSLEMSDDDIGQRLLSSAMTKPVSEIVNSHRLTDEDKRQIDQAVTKLVDYPILLDDTAVINPVTMKTKIQQLVSAGNPPGLVIVDYLQLVKLQGMGSRSRAEEVSDISRNLKLLAKEFRIPVIALSQLNRKAEERGTPQMSDLRESGAIEQDADTIMFIERPDVKEDNGNKQGTEEETSMNGMSSRDAAEAQPAYIILAKNRHGGIGKDTVWWIPSKTMFYEYTGRDPVEPGSVYKKTVSGDTAAQDYDFDKHEDEPQPPMTEEDEMQQEEDRFMADLNEGYPEGFLED